MSRFQVSFAVLAMVVCFAAAAEEAKTPSAPSAADRSKRGLVAPLVAAPYVAAPYAAAPYAVASPYAAAPYAAAAPYPVASPYAAAPYAVASPYASPYVSSYTAYPYVAKTLVSPYAHYPWTSHNSREKYDIKTTAVDEKIETKKQNK